MVYIGRDPRLKYPQYTVDVGGSVDVLQKKKTGSATRDEHAVDKRQKRDGKCGGKQITRLIWVQISNSLVHARPRTSERTTRWTPPETGKICI